MRTAIAVTLIICGTFLVAIPPASDYLHSRIVAHLLEQSQGGSVSLVGRLSDGYRFGCFALGMVMLIVAVVASLRRDVHAPASHVAQFNPSL